MSLRSMSADLGLYVEQYLEERRRWVFSVSAFSPFQRNAVSMGRLSFSPRVNGFENPRISGVTTLTGTGQAMQLPASARPA
jgi:hypothetical protein